MKYFVNLSVTLSCLVMLCSNAYCQDKNLPKETYIAANIPDSLKEDANSVVRYCNDEVTINGPGKAVIKHHKIVTILNEQGEREAEVVLPYNRKFDTFTDISIRAYDADGLLLKKYHKSDMYDGSLINYEAIVTDDRFLGLHHVIANYPSTIEVEYEEDLDSFFSLDDWTLQHIEQSVQEENYTVYAKSDIGFTYHNKNTNIVPGKDIKNFFYEYTWHVKNLKAIKKEEYAMAWTVLPAVSFGTDVFSYYGYAGEMDTWQNFGKWIYGLNNDVCTLSPERTAEIKKMTDGFKTDKEKAEFLYKYLQQNTRYVSIQLGVGGFKPFAASFVDQKKYGDCKALANYMYALLKAVNIPSYWAIVRAGFNEPGADPDFPNNHFNHEILCIPFKNDTTWLDCTMTTRPFGKPGPFTEDRNALLITENGGKLVNTPRSRADENQFNSEVHLSLDSLGGATAKVKILYTGEYREACIQLAAEKEDKQKEELLDELNMKQPAVFDLKYSNDNDGVKEMDMSLEYDKFCDIATADKQFYHTNVFSLSNTTVPILDKRKTDFYFSFPRIRTCTTTIDLPAGYTVETIPPNQDLKFTYGNYSVKYSYDAVKNIVTSDARFVLNKHVIPAAKYTEMQQYLDAIAKAQNKKLVIRRKA